MGPYNLTTITALLLGACQAGISICLAYTTSRSPSKVFMVAFCPRRMVCRCLLLRR